MRLPSVTLAENLLGNLRNLNAKQAQLQGRVATNQRIAVPSDDPAAARRVIRLESERRAVAQYASNAARAREVSQASFSGLQQIKKVADRAAEVAVAADGLSNPEQRAASAAEINQLIEQAAELGNSKFGGDHVFAGTATDVSPFVIGRDHAGRVTDVTYAGNDAPAAIAVGDGTELAPGTSGDVNRGIGALITRLIALRDGLDAGDTAGVAKAGTSLQASADDLVLALAEQGAVQTRLDWQDAVLSGDASRVELAVSKEVDDDLAATMVKLNQTSVAYQAALQSAASIMKTSLLDYLH